METGGTNHSHSLDSPGSSDPIRMPPAMSSTKTHRRQKAIPASLQLKKYAWGWLATEKVEKEVSEVSFENFQRVGVEGRIYTQHELQPGLARWLHG